MSVDRPTVLCLSGHDPGGGAGVQADIETVAALGGHALSIITAQTVQDSSNVARVVGTDPRLLREQGEALFADFPVKAVKIGLLGDAAQVPVLADLVRRAGAPLVIDPVLRAGGGAELVSPALVAALSQGLLPLAEVLTPNAAEARRLAPGGRDLDACGAELLRLGARHVLISGGDEPGDPVVNRWYAGGRPVRCFAWPRLAGAFHGAGCTLAAAIAALLARGLPVAQALEDAQAYTQRALSRAYRPGRGRQLPGRIG